MILVGVAGQLVVVASVMLCLCLPNLLAREHPVSPTYTFLQVAAQINCFDLQFPPSLTLIMIQFCGFVMFSNVQMFLQRAQFRSLGSLLLILVV